MQHESVHGTQENPANIDLPANVNDDVLSMEEVPEAQVAERHTVSRVPVLECSQGY